MEIIKSTSNEKIKHLVKLRDDAKTRKEHNEFLIEGLNMVDEALKHNLVKKIYIIDNKNLVGLKFNTNDLEIILISQNIANKIAATKHTQGIFAVCKTPFFSDDFSRNTLILDDLQDPGNLGTLIRSAACFNFTNVISSKSSVSFFNAKVIRSSQGNMFNVNLLSEELTPTLAKLKLQGYTIVGTVLSDQAKPISQVNWKTHDKIALIIGNEGKGISKKLQNFIDVNVNIKMNINVESLNAAIAGSIIMHQIAENHN